MLRVHSIESRANAGAGVRSDTANPSKTHRQADRRIKFAPRELTQGGGALRQGLLWRCRARRAAAGWRARQTPCTPQAAVTDIARNNLVHPIRRARIPAQISPSTPDESCRAAFTKLAPLNPEQMLLSTREVSSPTRRKHIVWWIVVAIYRAGNLPTAPFRFGTRALSLRWAGQFLRLGDHVFARKQKSRTQCKLSHCTCKNLPLSRACHLSLCSPNTPTGSRVSPTVSQHTVHPCTLADAGFGWFSVPTPGWCG
jgi:hypothetical protein